MSSGNVGYAQGQQDQTYQDTRMSVASLQDLGIVIRSWSDARDAGHPPTIRSNREEAHLRGECYGRGNGAQPIFAMIGIEDIKTLEGRLLRIVEAAFGDPIQRKAVKDLIRAQLWFDWIPNLDTDSSSCGMPPE